MPSSIVLNKNALPICRAFRNFLGHLAKEASDKGQNVDLSADVKVRIFLKVVDCPDTWLETVKFWNNNIV
jgi:hypothetical protein